MSRNTVSFQEMGPGAKLLGNYWTVVRKNLVWPVVFWPAARKWLPLSIWSSKSDGSKHWPMDRIWYNLSLSCAELTVPSGSLVFVPPISSECCTRQKSGQSLLRRWKWLPSASFWGHQRDRYKAAVQNGKLQTGWRWVFCCSAVLWFGDCCFKYSCSQHTPIPLWD